MTNNATESSFVDVRDLIREVSVEELCRTAEAYFARIRNRDYHLAKPFTSIDETPELLTQFAQLLQGLRPLPGMTVLDFGAGSCWTSRFFTQMGYKVIAVDVSHSALDIGRELYRRQPVFGDQPEPVFLPFDGRRFDLPDQSVDRINCFDAFHHVPNPDDILSEMFRVLRGGGIAGFSEPGPEHSKTPQSQQAMRVDRVVESDVNMDEVWHAARDAGFTDLKLALFSSNSFLTSISDFERFLAAKESQAEAHADQTRDYLRNRRVFFLSKGEPAAPDSRQRAGLAAQLNVQLTATRVSEGRPFEGRMSATNTGTTTWLPGTAPHGPVLLGVHLFDRAGVLLNLDHARHRVTQGDGQPVAPGQTVGTDLVLPSPAKGKYTLVFDLVSEGVCWFETNGSQTVSHDVEVF